MSKGFDFLVSSLERRYDHHSARTMGREVLAQAGLEEQKEYSDQEMQQLADALASVGDGDLDKVWQALGKAPKGVEVAAEEKPEEDKESGKDESKKDEKKDESKKDETKEEAKKDESSEAKKDESKDDKKSSSKSGGSKKK